MNDYLYKDGIETERLVTRFLDENDVPLWAKFFESEEAVKFHPNPENRSSMERSEYWIARQIERYKLLQYGHQALVDKKTNALIGQCGLLLQDVEGVPEIEIGYHVLRKYWGQGYATEAAIGFKNFGFNNKQADSIVSLIDVNNLRSQRVALKNGMKRETQIFRAWHDIFIYRIDMQIWEEK